MSTQALVAEQEVARLVVEAAGDRPEAALVVTQQVATLIAAAEQGPAGRHGVDGVADYGTQRYTEQNNLPATEMTPGVSTRFTITNPILDSRLNGVFQGHEFLDAGGLVRARKANDSYLIRVRMSVAAMVAGGTITVDILIADNVSGLAGPSGSKTATLSEQAGDEERVDLLFQVAPGGGFLANGAEIMVRTSVPAFRKNEQLFFTPLVAAP